MVDFEISVVGWEATEHLEEHSLEPVCLDPTTVSAVWPWQVFASFPALASSPMKGNYQYLYLIGL